MRLRALQRTKTHDKRHQGSLGRLRKAQGSLGSLGKALKTLKGTKRHNFCVGSRSHSNKPSPSIVVNKFQLISQLPIPPTHLNSPFPQERPCDSQITSLKSNPPDLLQIQCFSYFPDLRVLSWNINRLQNEEKLEICKRMAASSHPLFIFL